MTDLSKAGVRAFKWGALSSVGRMALQLGAQIVLARMLGPENYGVFGIGMLVLTLSTFLTGFGFSWSLLYKPAVSDEDIRFAFTWQVIAGLVALLLLQASAAWVAEYFREPRAESVIRWLSIACVLSSATAPATSLLQRDLSFKAVGLIQMGSYFAGYLCVGIPAAYLGMGAEALVAAWLTQALVALVGTYAVKRHPLRPLVTYEGWRDAMGRGVTIFMNNVVNWGLNNVDRLVVGRVLNTQAIGHYTVGYNLAATPNSLLLGALQPAFIAAGAQMADDRPRLRAAYTQIMAAVLVLILPAYVWLASISPNLIALFYGAQWHVTGDILRILFLGMPAYVLWGVTTPVLTNSGRLHHESLLQLPVLLIGTACLFWFTTSPVMAAWIAVGMLQARMLMMVASAFQVLGMRGMTVFPDMLRGAVLSALVAGSAIGAQTLVAPLGLPVAGLLAAGLAALAIALFVIFVTPRLLGPGGAQMLTKFVPMLGTRLRR